MRTLDDLLADYDVRERHRWWVAGAAEAGARRAFRRYRLVVGQFSASIRRRRPAAADRTLR